MKTTRMAAAALLVSGIFYGLLTAVRIGLKIQGLTGAVVTIGIALIAFVAVMIANLSFFVYLLLKR